MDFLINTFQSLDNMFFFNTNHWNLNIFSCSLSNTHVSFENVVNNFTGSTLGKELFKFCAIYLLLNNWILSETLGLYNCSTHLLSNNV